MGRGRTQSQGGLGCAISTWLAPVAAPGWAIFAKDSGSGTAVTATLEPKHGEGNGSSIPGEETGNAFSQPTHTGCKGRVAEEGSSFPSAEKNFLSLPCQAAAPGGGNGPGPFPRARRGCGATRLCGFPERGATRSRALLRDWGFFSGFLGFSGRARGGPGLEPAD